MLGYDSYATEIKAAQENHQYSLSHPFLSFYPLFSSPNVFFNSFSNIRVSDSSGRGPRVSEECFSSLSSSVPHSDQNQLSGNHLKIKMFENASPSLPFQ